MTERILLDPEQERDAQRIAREASGAALDASTMSAGKTVVALRAAQLRGDRVIVIIAPLQTRLGWKSTASIGWRTSDGDEGDFADLPFHWIRSDKKRDGIVGALKFREPGIYFIGLQYAVALSWDKVGYKYLTEPDGSPKIDRKTGKQKRKLIKKRNHFWKTILPDMLVVDEIHKGNTTTTTQTWKALEGMGSEFKLGLSGTPHGNRFDGIYPVTKFLWPEAVPKNLQAFKSRFCEYDYDPFSWDHMKVTGESNPGEYFASLPCVVRRVWKYEGVIDREEIYVELSAEQRKAYNDLEKRMVTWLDEHPFVVEFPASLRIRLRQASLGMFYVNDDGEVDFREDCRSTKFDALKKCLAEDFEDEPALILTDSKKFAKIVASRIRGEVWSGDQSATRREEIKLGFMDGSIKYVVMVIKAGGTGTDGLQYATRNIAVLSVDDSGIENDQAIARGVRRGQGDLVRLRYIVAVNTYDQGILSKHTANAVQMNRSMRLRDDGD